MPDAASSHRSRKESQAFLKNLSPYAISGVMKHALWTFFFLLGITSTVHAESQLLDQVIAVVNDEVITQSELDILLRPVYIQFKAQYSEAELNMKMAEARQKILNQLVEDKLVYQEAKTQKIEVDEASIDEDLEAFKQRFKSESELEDALQKEGLSMKEMRDRIRRQAMIRQLQDREIRARVVVSPLEVEAYFNEHPEEFSTDERIKVRSITIKKDDIAREKGMMDEAAKNKIEDLRNKILSGESFGKLAKEFSQDTNAEKEGLGDWLQRGSMISIIDDVIFNLKTGEISKVVESPMGYHVFRIEERQEKLTKTLEQARNEIYNKLYSKKFLERFEEWMKELKRSAYISIR